MWKKKVDPRMRVDNDFNITMGSFDGAESTDLVGLFLLHKLKGLKVSGKSVICGLYRDDGLLVTKATGRQLKLLHDDLIKFFRKYHLSIKIDPPSKTVDFLDISLDLTTSLYKPFIKPNNTIKYVHSKSNHPPATIKNIPKNVNDRLSKNSATQEIFEEASGVYQDALDASEFNHKLSYNINVRNVSNSRNRKRTRKITWFNPPFSSNVKTNIGKLFLQMVKECFPPSHPLHKICNRNTLKLSYRTMPNMKKAINQHNSKILNNENQSNGMAGCTSVCDDQCPLPGNCKVTNVVYRATVTRSDNNTTETYTGSTYRTFRTRFNEHMNDMRNPSRDGTTLSGHIWHLKGLGVPYDIKWEIAGRAQPFNPATGQCRLCLLEKYFIMFNKDGASLNQRTEFFSHCYHKAPLLLQNQKFK